MRVFKIPQELAAQYHGCGYALAAIVDEKVVAIKYLRDIVPAESFETDEGTFIPSVIKNARIGAVAKELDSTGAVSIGMISSWEFCEI